MLKHIFNTARQYIFIILTATIFVLVLISKSFCDENIFAVNEVKVEGKVDVNFTREKYINKAFLDSFKILMSKVLVSSDLNKIKKMKLNEVRSLISSFKILNEKYVKGNYEVTFSIFYSEKKIKSFLANKNISFSEPKDISVVLFPILFVEDQAKSFNENIFYKEWINVKVKNDVINFILPLEDLDELEVIQNIKNKIEEIDIAKIVKKYNNKNYVLLFMYFEKKKLNTYIKMNFDGNKISKNIFYKIDNLNNEDKIDFIIKDLKIKLLDFWKEMNFVNLLMPLSITFKYEHSNIRDLDKLKNTLSKINLIDNYFIEKFNTESSSFKIYYFGNPKRLSSELLKFGYKLKNNQGYWELF